MKKSRLLLIAFLFMPFHVLLAQMGGVYTIGKNGTENFSSFFDAVFAVAQQGIIDKIVFKVSDGTYEEQLFIPRFNNSTFYNPIIFESASGDSSAVILTYKPEDPLDNFTILLEKATNIYIRSITIATDTITGRLVELERNVENIQFENCVFRGMRDGAELIYAPCASGLSNNYIILKNNRFEYGSKAISLCANTSLYDANLIIENNVFADQSQQAINLKYQAAPSISGNIFIKHIAHDNYSGILMESCANKTTITANRFILSASGQNSSGIRFFKNGGTLANEALIANNFFFINADIFAAGILLNNSFHTQIYNNSFNMTGAASGSTALSFILSNYVDFRNNIFSHKAGGYGLISSISNNLLHHHNLWHSTGEFIANFDNIMIPDTDSLKSYSSQAASSFTLDPLYCSDSNLMTYYSHLNGKGLKLGGITKDIMGKNRPDPPSVGAVEVSSFNYDLGNDREICAYESVNIDAGDGFLAYLWHDSSTNMAFNFTPQSNETDSMYIWVRVDKEGCFFYDTIKLMIHPYPVFNLGDDTVICKNYTDSFSLFAPTGYASYLWHDDSERDYWTKNSLNSKDTGNYLIWLKITSDRGCFNADTIILRLEKCGSVREKLRAEMVLFPNPATNCLRISSQSYLGASTVIIYSTDGKLIRRIDTYLPDNDIDVSELSSGIYLLRLINGIGEFRFSFLKQ